MRSDISLSSFDVYLKEKKKKKRKKEMTGDGMCWHLFSLTAILKIQ